MRVEERSNVGGLLFPFELLSKHDFGQIAFVRRVKRSSNCYKDIFFCKKT